MKTTHTTSALLVGLIALLGCKQDAFVGTMDLDNPDSGTAAPPIQETGGTAVPGTGGAGGTTATGDGGATTIPTTPRDAGGGSTGSVCAPISTAPGVVNPCGRTFGLDLSPDGRFVAIGIEGSSPTVKVWRLSDGMPAVELESTNSETTYDVAFSPDGSTLAAAQYDGKVKIWNMSTGALVRTLSALTMGYVDSVEFSHDGTLIATGGFQGSAQIWRASDGALVRTIPVPTSAHNVHFSLDDALLVVATVDGKANIWNVATGALALTVATTSEMADASFSPDGRQIASTGDGNLVQIWDAADGTLLQKLPGHTGYISHVVWVDNDRLLSDDWAGTVNVWQRDASGSFALARTWSTGGQGLGMAVLPDKSAFAVGAGGGAGQGFAFYALTSVPAQVVEVAAGHYHTCVLMADSTVRCWGFNYGGQVGNGKSGDTVLTPTSVSGLAGVVHIDADYTDSCAQLSDGTVRCWGFNSYGQLGDGTMIERDTPVSVLGGRSAQQVSLAAYHSCALLTDGSVVWYGLGVKAGDVDGQAYATPLPVPGIAKAKQISAGAVANCALLEDGTVRCWGGESSLTDIPLASQAVAGVSQVLKVAVATATVCALLPDGTVKCWGRNTYGTVGDGTTVDRDSPTSVLGLSGVADLIAGEDHFCALLATGNVMCWGSNNGGQLGDGTKTNRFAPVAVAGLAGVKQVSAGVTHTCALTNAGEVKCWGDEFAYVSDRFSGGSPNANRLTPTAVSF